MTESHSNEMLIKYNFPTHVNDVAIDSRRTLARTHVQGRKIQSAWFRYTVNTSPHCPHKTL